MEGLTNSVRKFVIDTAGIALVTPGCLLDTTNVDKAPTAGIGETTGQKSNKVAAALSKGGNNKAGGKAVDGNNNKGGTTDFFKRTFDELDVHDMYLSLIDSLKVKPAVMGTVGRQVVCWVGLTSMS